MTETRASSEIACEKSFLLLISATTTPMMSATGLVMPAWNRGFCFRIAASNVLPARGRPEMKWNALDGFAESGAAGTYFVTASADGWASRASAGGSAQRTTSLIGGSQCCADVGLHPEHAPG